MTRTRRDRRSFGSQRSKTRRTRLLSILQVTSVNRLVPVQANSVILLISASFFPPPPSSKRDRSASLDPISPPRIRYIPYWSFDVPFDMPDRRQKPAGMRHRGGRSRMKGGGTSPFRNWSQDNSGATVLNIDSIVRAAAASSRSIRIRRFALRSRYVAPFSELVRSLYLFGNACKYVVFRNWKRSSGLTSSASKNFPTVDLDDQVLTDSR